VPAGGGGISSHQPQGLPQNFFNNFLKRLSQSGNISDSPLLTSKSNQNLKLALDENAIEFPMWRNDACHDFVRR
jgi:hypothetical protein